MTDVKGRAPGIRFHNFQRKLSLFTNQTMVMTLRRLLNMISVVFAKSIRFYTDGVFPAKQIVEK
jgi:hypothetical protein